MGLLNLFKKNDWILFESDNGIWTRGGEPVSYAYYNIEWSESRQEFRLKLEGDKPKNHPHYGEMLKRMATLNKELLNDPARKRDKKLKQLGI